MTQHLPDACGDVVTAVVVIVIALLVVGLSLLLWLAP